MAETKRILITGGSGFVGTNLLEHFSAQGVEVANFDILPPRNPRHRPFWQQIDIRDRSALLAAVAAFQPDQVVHCAARTDLDEKTNLDGYSANIDGVCHLIEAIRRCASVERVLFFSSQLVCRVGYTPRDEFDTQPSTLYGRSKVIGEKIVRAAGDFGPAWAILRPTSLWGPWFGVPYKNFFDAIARGLYVHPAGVDTRKQWGYIGNAVHQVDRLLSVSPEKIRHKTFYLADYAPVRLKEIADSIQRRLGAPPVRAVPYPLLKTAARAGDILKALGWRKPPLTSFRLNNIVVDEIQELAPLEAVVGSLPFDLEQGVDSTAAWMTQEPTR